LAELETSSRPSGSPDETYKFCKTTKAEEPVNEIATEISLPTVLITVAAVLSPYLTALFIRANMSEKVKQIISAVVSAVLALAYIILKGDVTDWETFIKAVPAVYMTSQLMYALFMKAGAKKVEAQYGLTVKSEEPTALTDEEVAKVAAKDEEEDVKAEDLVVTVEETPRKG
jgi:hypothetical protein